VAANGGRTALEKTCQVTGQIGWVLLAAAALLAIFAPLTGYLYTRRA
jgi:hypothetical protein